MSHFDTTGQLALFPELIDSPELPSISTLPEFDRALHNLIKMSDLGAFISITVHGLDKSFSVHARELEIPEDFLLDGRGDAASQQIHLFPESLRHQVRRLSYDVKRFFKQRKFFSDTVRLFPFSSLFQDLVKVCQRTGTTIDRLFYRRSIRQDLWKPLHGSV